jgi:surface protein
MPTVTSSQQTFVGLYAVIENSDNYAAFLFTTDSGQYEVDWGDGTVDLVNSNTLAQHEYNFVTYDPTNSTLTTRGYKQAMITVTPVSGNLLTCNFQQRFVTVPAQNQAYSTGFLDCILSMPNAISGAFRIIFGGTTVRHSFVERFDIKTIGSATVLTSLFENCFSLQSIPWFNTVNVTSMGNMFFNCISLRTIPLLDTSSVTSMSQMFRGCSTLQTIPLLNTSSVTQTSSMFNSCPNLQSIPLLDTSSVTNMDTMFQNCFTINNIPPLDTTLVNANFSMFIVCNSLNRCQMVFQRTVSFANCQLSRDAIVEIFNNLAVVVSETITITGNWGVTALTPAQRAIALNKNWTITA